MHCCKKKKKVNLNFDKMTFDCGEDYCEGVESRECEILKTAFKEGASLDIMNGRRVNVTITSILSQVVWMCSLRKEIL